MHPSNPPPLNNVPSSKRTSVVFEPYALHMIASVIRDLQFLRQQGYISFAALEEIIERLPKPVVHATPHTPPAPSPSSSPIPQPESPAVSIKSDISQKRNSNTSISQRPPSTSSQNLQQLQQQEEQTLHSLAQDNFGAEENQNQQLQHKSARRQSPITTPQQINTTPPPLQNSSPSQSQLQQNDDDVVNAGHPQLDSIPKPAVPSRASVYQPVSPVPSVPSPQSSSNISLNTSSNTNSSTGAILATRPLPLPPNAPNSSPPRPQPLPVFNNKYEEAEYEKSINHQQLKDTALPAYSLSIVEAMWDFVGDDAGDLSFKKGDIVEVVEYVNMDWWRGRIQGTSNVGIFPKIYTKILNTQAQLNQVIPDQPVANNTAYYNQRLPQHSNNMTPYSSQHYQLSQSPSQLQHQQLPPTQQQLPPTQQNTYTTYQHHPSSVQTVYDSSVYANHASNVASQHHYLNTRSSTTSLNNQQQYYKYS